MDSVAGSDGEGVSRDRRRGDMPVFRKRREGNMGNIANSNLRYELVRFGRCASTDEVCQWNAVSK